MQAQIIVDRFLRGKISHTFKLNVYERILLFILGSYIGKDKSCNPSYLALSIDCGMSDDTVRRHIKLLEMKKLIIIKRSIGDNNDYRLNIPEIILTAGSTHCSQQVLADSNDQHLPTAIPLYAVSSPNNITNNISNNIKEYSPSFSSKKQSVKGTATVSKCPLPENMTINDSHKAKANELGLNVDAEFDHFKEHHIAKGNIFSDWDMAFHLWLRNAAKFSRKNTKSSTENVMLGIDHEK